MIFLNLALLAGAAAAAIPIALHLLHRHRRRPPVAWGAMFLLDRAAAPEASRKRRVRLGRWPLLLARCAIPVLLALAMARPALTRGDGPPAGDAPASLVVVIDASASMNAPGPDGRTAHDEARDAARELIAALPRGSEAAVLVAGGGVRPLGDRPGLLAPDEAAATLDDLPAGLGRLDLPAAFAAADALLDAAASHPLRRVAVVSDFRGVVPVAPTPDLTLVRVGVEATPDRPSLSVGPVALDPNPPTPGRAVRVRAEVRNAGPRAARDLPVRLEIDGTTRGLLRLDVPADGTAQASFDYTFDTAGPAVLRVAVDAAVAGDPLADDDATLAVVDVPRPPRVLILAGEVGRPFAQNPADFLALALSPEDDDAFRVTVARAGPAAFDADDLADADVVVLADAPRPEPQQADALTAFVESGGGLLILPGGSSDASWLAESDLAAAAPLALRDDVTRIAEPPYDHPALLPWNAPDASRLSAATIRRWYALAPKPGSAVALSLNTGGPLAVGRDLGSGRTMTLALPLSGEWSDLPLRASFAPLVRRLARHVAETRDTRTVVAGEPLTLDPAGGGGDLVVVTPRGDRRSPLARDCAAVFADTAAPGLYRFERDGEVVATFAVNLPAGEADPAPAAALDADARPVADVLEAEHERRHGREVWRPFWAAALVAIFAELLLVNAATRGAA